MSLLLRFITPTPPASTPEPLEFRHAVFLLLLAAPRHGPAAIPLDAIRLPAEVSTSRVSYAAARLSRAHGPATIPADAIRLPAEVASSAAALPSKLSRAYGPASLELDRVAEVLGLADLATSSQEARPARISRAHGPATIPADAIRLPAEVSTSRAAYPAQLSRSYGPATIPADAIRLPAEVSASRVAYPARLSRAHGPASIPAEAIRLPAEVYLSRTAHPSRLAPHAHGPAWISVDAIRDLLPASATSLRLTEAPSSAPQHGSVRLEQIDAIRDAAGVVAQHPTLTPVAQTTQGPASLVFEAAQDIASVIVAKLDPGASRAASTTQGPASLVFEAAQDIASVIVAKLDPGAARAAPEHGGDVLPPALPRPPAIPPSSGHPREKKKIWIQVTHKRVLPDGQVELTYSIEDLLNPEVSRHPMFSAIIDEAPSIGIHETPELKELRQKLAAEEARVRELEASGGKAERSARRWRFASVGLAIVLALSHLKRRR